MNIEHIMSKVVVSVEMDDSLKIVKEIFDNAGFHHLIVLDELGKLFGVISDRDLLRSISPYLNTPAETPRDLATLNKKAHQILTRKPITLPATADIIEAIVIFNKYKISCIPIVSVDQKLLGIISWRDILKAIEFNENH